MYFELWSEAILFLKEQPLKIKLINALRDKRAVFMFAINRSIHPLLSHLLFTPFAPVKCLGLWGRPVFPTRNASISLHLLLLSSLLVYFFLLLFVSPNAARCTSRQKPPRIMYQLISRICFGCNNTLRMTSTDSFVCAKFPRSR